MISIQPISLFKVPIIILVLSLLVNSPCLASDDETAIPFSLDGHGIMLNVKINSNSDPYKFVFDTGGRTAVNPKLFHDLDIVPTYDQKIYGFDARWYFYKLDSIRIGPVKRENCELESAVFSNRDIFAGFNGIVGPKFFDGYIFTIDYKNQTLSISDDSVPIEVDSNAILIKYIYGGFPPLIYIPLTLNDNIRVKAIFDTGSPDALILPTSYIDSLRDVLGTSLIQSRGTIIEWTFGKLEKSYLGRLPLIKIGDHEFRNIPVYFYDNLTCIGKEFLEAFRTSVDQKRGLIQLEEFDDVEIKTNIISYGLNGRPNDSGQVSVMGVWEGSPADEAGINPGDEIVEINGKQVSEYSHSEIYDVFDNEQENEIELIIKNDSAERRISLRKRALLPEIETN